MDKRTLEAAGPIFAARLAKFSISPPDESVTKLAYEALRQADVLIHAYERVSAAGRATRPRSEAPRDAKVPALP